METNGSAQNEEIVVEDSTEQSKEAATEMKDPSNDAASPSFESPSPPVSIAEKTPLQASVQARVRPDKAPTPKRSAPKNDLEEANDEIAQLLLTNKITVRESSKFQSVLRENASLKEKVTKLKTLLARSAKASKETKHELEQHKRLLDVAKKEVERLNDRVEQLANRPTHMDLLADFETNFDRALMNLNTDDMHMVQQSVGQTTDQKDDDEENMTNLLMGELTQSKARVESLESVNTTLKKRHLQMEKQNESIMQERESGEFFILWSSNTCSTLYASLNRIYGFTANLISHSIFESLSWQRI